MAETTNFGESMKISPQIFATRVAMPLKAKVLWTQKRIKEFVEWALDENYNPCVNFSGGADSTVLLTIARDMFPSLPALFSNTGLEYPEIVENVGRYENVHIVRPQKPFHLIVKEYGWPIISKKVANMIRIVRENSPTRTNSIRVYTTGITSTGQYSPRWKIPNKWMYLLNAPFKISDLCCEYLKKEPFHRFKKEHNAVCILGTLATESEQRRASYLRTGCNSFTASRGAQSTPMAFWTKKDIWEFIHTHGIKYPSVYDMGYSSTGCIFCGFGAHLSTPNRFQLLHKTHPKQWEYVIHKLDMGTVLEYIGLPTTERGLYD